MPLFNWFRQNNLPKESPSEILQKLVDYMPAFYHDQRQFIYCKNYLDHQEWGLALESLIELAEETSHYFSEEYWTMLADAADTMNLKAEHDYCKKQINKNQQDVRSKTPFGWTTVKIDDTHFQHYISEKLKEERVQERRKKDGFFNYYPKDGVYVKSHGRAGTIYYVKNRAIAEISYEIGAVADLIVFFETVNQWALPEKKPMTAPEKQLLKDELLAWARSSSATIDLA